MSSQTSREAKYKNKKLTEKKTKNFWKTDSQRHTPIPIEICWAAGWKKINFNMNSGEVSFIFC